MAQFTAYRNLSPGSRERIPFLLDVQAEILADLSTRVVVPLYSATAVQGKLLQTLTPRFRVGGRSCVMATPELAGVPRKLLGVPVADLSGKRTEIIAALDLLITGI